MILQKVDDLVEIMKLHPYVTPLTELNVNWTGDLNVNSETIKLLEENVGKKLNDMGPGKDFMDMTQKHKQPKQK